MVGNIGLLQYNNRLLNTYGQPAPYIYGQIPINALVSNSTVGTPSVNKVTKKLLLLTE